MIDAHVHLYPGDPQPLADRLAALGTARFNVLGVPGIWGSDNNLHCLRMKALYPGRAWVFGGLNWRGPECPLPERQLELMMLAGFDGLKLLETKPEITDARGVEAVYGDNFHPLRENWPGIRGDIEFDHVSFQYGGGAWTDAVTGDWDGNGTTTYNVERLGVVLAANDLQIGRGQQTAYIPFALCRTRTHAQETIDRMKRKQATLAALNEPRDESGEDLGVTICMEADVAGEGVPV